MSRYMLDASAILAVLNEEPGAEAVEKILEQSVVSAVNLSEVVACLVLEGVPAEQACQVVTDIVQDVIDFDTEIALLAGQLAPLAKPLGLSLGDRACLATAQKLGLEAVTADKVWQKLKASVQVKVIR